MANNKQINPSNKSGRRFGLEDGPGALNGHAQAYKMDNIKVIIG